MSLESSPSNPLPVDGTTPLDAAPLRSLSHYQRVDKDCISIQILPYARPYVIPFSKVKTGDALATVVATLPEVWKRAKDVLGVIHQFDTGAWRLVDEAGLALRVQDWEDMIYAGAFLILDTNAALTRESERLDAGRQVKEPAPAPAPETEKYQIQPADDIRAPSEHAPPSEPAPPSEDLIGIREDQLPRKPSAAHEEHEGIRHGDPEWMSWGGAPDVAENGWDDGGHVPAEKDSWNDHKSNGNSEVRTPSEVRAPFDLRGPSEVLHPKPFMKTKDKWHAAQASGNTWDKSKYPPKVHLTFFAPFQLPRKYPPTPYPAYSRFSIDVGASVSRVVNKVLERTEFRDMRPRRHFDEDEFEYTFLELRYKVVHGKPMLDRGRVRRVKGKVSMADLGLTVDGGEEGMGRYYFMVDDFFAPSSDRL